METHSPTTARDLSKLLNVNGTTGKTSMWVTTVVLMLSATIFMGLLGWLGYRYYMIQKAQGAINVVGEQS